MRYALVVVITFFSLLLCAQEDHGPDKSALRDSILRQRSADSAHIYRPLLIKPYLKVENRHSFLSFFPFNLYGMFAGLTYRERHVFSAGLFVMDPRVSETVYIVDNFSGKIRMMNQYLICYQYIIYNRRYFQINLPLEAGMGMLTIERGTGETMGPRTEHVFYPVSLSFQSIFKPFSWLGASGLIGYRYAPGARAGLRLSGWQYSVGCWIDARQLFRNTRYVFLKRKYKRQLRALQ